MRRLVAFLAAALAVSCGGASGSAQQPADLRALTLRLPDLARGYVIGDDTGCGDMGIENAPARLAELVLRFRARSCNVLFERAWRSAGVQPDLVDSVALRTTEEGARALLDEGGELAAYMLEPQSFGIAARPKLGNEALLLRTWNALVRGRVGNPGVAVVWRHGSTIGIVFAADRRPVSERHVLDLAAIQQRRVEEPTPLVSGDFDDREVQLDNPRLGIRVVWLGRQFAPPALPRLDLRRSTGPIPLGGGPGNRVMIEYAAGGHQTGVALYLWDPREWRRFVQTRLGRLVWATPCARSERIRIRGGRAVIYAGYAHGGTQRPCPVRAPDRALAHVFLRDVVVAVNIPHCFLCVDRPRDAYNTIRGLRAAVAALRPRPRR